MTVTRRAAVLGVGVSGLGLGSARGQGEIKPIRIGVLEDMSGVFSELGGNGSLVAVRMAVADFGGSVLGRPIEVLSGDHQNKPDVGAAVARRWFDVDDVSLITGLTNSAVALEVHRLAADKNRIDIVVNAATDALVEDSCSANGILWNHSARAIVTATVTQAAKTAKGDWFFITSDYAGGRVMEVEAAPIIAAAGAKLLGSVHPPLGTTDFSSELLTAQSSGARFLGVVTFGRDFANLMKQFAEFGLAATMQPIVPFVYLSDLHAVGPSVIGGMTVAAPFYWDLNERTRAWSKRFRSLTGRAPDMGQGGAYAATSHYLKGLQQAGTDEAGTVLKAMRALPVDDMYTDKGFIREDGMLVRPIYLFRGRRPDESHDEWDLLRNTGVVERAVAFPTPVEPKCSLLRKT